MFAFGIAHFVRLEALKTQTRQWRVEDPTVRGMAAAVDEGTTVRDRARLRSALGELKEVERQIYYSTLTKKCG